LDPPIFHHSRKEGVIVELVGRDSLDGGYRPTEHMIASTIHSRALDGEHIEIVLHDAESVVIALGITTDLAARGRDISHTMAELALLNLGVDIR